MLNGMAKIATSDILTELGRTVKVVAVHLMRTRVPTETPSHLVKFEETVDLLEVKRIKVICKVRIGWETYRVYNQCFHCNALASGVIFVTKLPDA